MKETFLSMKAKWPILRLSAKKMWNLLNQPLVPQGKKKKEIFFGKIMFSKSKEIKHCIFLIFRKITFYLII